MERVAEMMPPRVASLMQLHLCVLLREESGTAATERQQSCWVLDFLPIDATSPATALSLFTGNAVPGQIRSKRLGRWIQGAAAFSTYRVGEVTCAVDPEQLQQVVEEFNKSWDTDLRLFSHDCRHYCSALLTKLTGREVSVEDLQNLVAASRLPPSS